MLRIRPVHRARRCVHEMADALPAAALEHMQKSGDVALHVDVRIADGMAHARLRGQMYDRAELVAVEDLLHGLPIGDIELVESKAALLAREWRVAPT